MRHCAAVWVLCPRSDAVAKVLYGNATRDVPSVNVVHRMSGWHVSSSFTGAQRYPPRHVRLVHTVRVTRCFPAHVAKRRRTRRQPRLTRTRRVTSLRMLLSDRGRSAHLFARRRDAGRVTHPAWPRRMCLIPQPLRQRIIRKAFRCYPILGPRDRCSAAELAAEPGGPRVPSRGYVTPR